MATTLGQFLEKATYCFVRKNSLLASMFKTGYDKYQKIQNDIKVLGMYFWLLRRIGNNYALTADQVERIMQHILSICYRKDLEIPDGTSVIGGGIIDPGGGTGGGIIIDIPVEIYTISYTGIEAFQVIVNYPFNKMYPNVIVVDTSGSTHVRVYPGITYVSENQVILDFVSTSSGIITII